MSRDATVVAEFPTDWPDWQIWRSRDDDGEPDSWYATRDRVLSDAEMESGLAHTLAADSARELRELLVEQRRIEAALWN